MVVLLILQGLAGLVVVFGPGDVVDVEVVE